MVDCTQCESYTKIEKATLLSMLSKKKSCAILTSKVEFRAGKD